MDLVEVAPNSKPPVCKILDFGKMKYEEKKKEQQSKKKQHVIKIKEIRIRPRIGEHDLENKLNMGRKFLKEGFKLKVSMMFRGREMSRIDLGEDVLYKVVEIRNISLFFFLSDRHYFYNRFSNYSKSFINKIVSVLITRHRSKTNKINIVI